MRARAFTRDGEVYLPDGQQPRVEQDVLAHELVHVVQQRTLGDALPPEWTAAGRALEHEAAAAPPDFGHEPHWEPQPPVPADVQRAPEPTVALVPPPIEDAPPEPEPDELAGYRDQLIALCDTRTVDLDDARSISELATKLYQPLRGLLRTELIVDRERAGLLPDFR